MNRLFWLNDYGRNQLCPLSTVFGVLEWLSVLVPEPYFQKVVALLKEANIGVVSDPHTGPLHAPVKELLEEGVLDIKLPNRGGCGAMSAAANSLFFRDGSHTMWDLERNTRQRFTGIRPGCWLGIIPAGGVLLAPETSAGCHCANPIQTSIAFTPKSTNGS